MPVVTLGDLELTYDDQGTGQAVVFISGLGSTRRAWEQQVPLFSAYFRTITFDNRDSGVTGAGSDDRFYVMRVFADDIALLLDASGIERAHIIGASLGGMIAQEFALHYPQRTQSLSLVSTLAKPDGMLLELCQQWEQFFSELGPIAWQRSTLPWCFTHRWFADPDHVREAVAGMVGTPNRQNHEMFLRQIHAIRRFDTLSRLQQIHVPTQIFCGSEDILIPLRHSQQLAEHIPGSTLTVIPNAGHAVQAENADALNKGLLRFILQHPA